MAELAIIIPTRGRPDNIRKVIGAWDATNAWDVADMILAIDEDDPEVQGYYDVRDEFMSSVPDGVPSPLKIQPFAAWLPMVHKLDETAKLYADNYWAVGFAGDDHLPRTINWAKAYLAALHDLQTGLVYGDDGYQHQNLCTEWAMTSDVVRELGRMVPAPVEHMYSDVSVLEVFRAAGAVRYLPQVVIEHMHPIVGKAENDDQYKRVNHRDQFRKDREDYERWQEHAKILDVAAVRSLYPDRPAPEPIEAKPGRSRRAYPEPNRAAWGTGRVARSNQPARSGPSVKRGPAMTFPRSSRRLTPKHLRDVQSLTPPEVGITLADLARNVPADQAIVELGVHHGYTALMLAWGAQEGLGAHVWGFDPWDMPGNVYEGMWDLASARKWAAYNVRAKGYGRRVTLTQMPSQDAASLWEGPSVGLLYVDGAHEYDAARADILAWLPLLAQGAVIAVDDYVDYYREHVIKAVDDLVAEGVLAPIQLYHDRLAVTRVANDPEARPVMVNDASKVIGRREDTLDISTVEETEAGPAQELTEADLPPDVPSAQEAATKEAEIQGAVRLIVQEGEVAGVPAGVRADTLTIAQLKELAKAREIVLGKRKDKRSEIVDAIRDGK